MEEEEELQNIINRMKESLLERQKLVEDFKRLYDQLYSPLEKRDPSTVR